MKIVKSQDNVDTLFSEKYKQTYHSIYGVQDEARYVFLETSAVLSLLTHKKEIHILEMGFGTGYNFFLTVKECEQKGVKLNYTAFENDLLGYETLKALNHNQNTALSQTARMVFLEWRKINPQLKAGKHCLQLAPTIALNLILQNAENAHLPANIFDAVYHDAFSPEENSELWNNAFFGKVNNWMKEGALLSTYSVKGTVRRSLQQAGFIIEKRPGPKGKREVLSARKETTQHK